MDEKTIQTQTVQSSKDILAFYNRYAKSWDERFGSQRFSILHFHHLRLESFLKLANLKKTDRLVELGVGTGLYLDIISPFVKEVICIDGSDQMLNVLRAKNRKLPNVKLFQMDLEYPLENVFFQADLVYWFGLIEHIIDVNTFIKNIKRMLPIGGRVVLIVANGRCPWYRGMRRLWRAGRHCSSDRYYTKDQLDNLMASHGFAPETAIYWGYFPPGVGNNLYKILTLLGKIAERTCLKRFAGGLTASYVHTGQT
jgi:SAM-dependent methyltransferase